MKNYYIDLGSSTIKVYCFEDELKLIEEHSIYFKNDFDAEKGISKNKFKEGKSLKKEAYQSLNKLQSSIVNLILDKPNITQEELARILDVNKRTIIRNFKTLIDKNYIKRIGTNKNGYWKVNKK